MYLARNTYPANTPPFVHEYTGMADERYQREKAAFAEVRAEHAHAHITQQLLDGTVNPDQLDIVHPSAQEMWQQAYDRLLPSVASALQPYGYQAARDAGDWWTFETHFLNEAESQPVLDVRDAAEIVQYRERKVTASDRMLLESDERYVQIFSYLTELARRYEPILMNGLADPFALETRAWQVYGSTAVDLALAAHGTGTNRDSQLVAEVDDPDTSITRIAARRVLPSARSAQYRFVLTDDIGRQSIHNLLADQSGIHIPRGQYDITTAQLVGEVFKINPAETWKRTKGNLRHILPQYADQLSRQPQTV